MEDAESELPPPKRQPAPDTPPPVSLREAQDHLKALVDLAQKWKQQWQQEYNTIELFITSSSPRLGPRSSLETPPWSSPSQGIVPSSHPGEAFEVPTDLCPASPRATIPSTSQETGTSLGSSSSSARRDAVRTLLQLKQELVVARAEADPGPTAGCATRGERVGQLVTAFDRAEGTGERLEVTQARREIRARARQEGLYPEFQARLQLRARLSSTTTPAQASSRVRPWHERVRSG